MLSFVTNATLDDAVRLDVFIPHVLNVFDSYIDELVIIIDPKGEEGRIKNLHASDSNAIKIDDQYLNRLKTIDHRIRIVECDYSKGPAVSRKWFGETGINRCQAGTPIFAFLFGIESCKNEKIIRSDCDIFFCDNGFCDLLKTDDKNHIIQLPRLNDEPIAFSTRDFFINRKKMETILPLKAYKLDVIRRMHRMINNRSPYLALEQMLDLSIRKNKVHFYKYSTATGYTMHISRREEFRDTSIQEVEKKFREGQIPAQQLQFNHDYHKNAWLTFNKTQIESHE